MVYGINSRKLKAKTLFGISRYTARMLRPFGVRDRSVQYPKFELAEYIPKHALKVAESGVAHSHIGLVRGGFNYNSALVGTALLNAPEGVEAVLNAFCVSRSESRSYAIGFIWFPRPRPSVPEQALAGGLAPYYGRRRHFCVDLAGLQAPRPFAGTSARFFLVTCLSAAQNQLFLASHSKL
jgi:hypothetical protein